MRHNTNQKGFSMVELIIVLAIFSLVISIAVAIFISIISQQRRILQGEEILNQASYALEYMTKGMRFSAKILLEAAQVLTEFIRE